MWPEQQYKEQAGQQGDERRHKSAQEKVLDSFRAT